MPSSERALSSTASRRFSDQALQSQAGGFSPADRIDLALVVEGLLQKIQRTHAAIAHPELVLQNQNQQTQCCEQKFHGRQEVTLNRANSPIPLY